MAGRFNRNTTGEKTLNDDDPAVFLGATSGIKTMADGTLRVQVDFMPTDMVNAVRAFGAPGSPVYVGRSTNASAVEADRPKGEYGKLAQALKLSGFFRTPKVWEAIGTDSDFLEWLKNQKSAKSNEYSWIDTDTGEGHCVPAHYRRVQHGSGTSIKPRYCAIPLTNDEHQLQHQQGHDAIGPNKWWEKQVIKHVSMWAWQSLKLDLGYDSWSDVPPIDLYNWAHRNELGDYLPLEYRNAATNTQSQATG